jgi:hypothetical protein
MQGLLQALISLLMVVQGVLLVQTAPVKMAAMQMALHPAQEVEVEEQMEGVPEQMLLQPV